MLSYPFGTQMPPQVLANDLSFYTGRTGRLDRCRSPPNLAQR
jgi:hypothetical protein